MVKPDDPDSLDDDRTWRRTPAHGSPVVVSRQSRQMMAVQVDHDEGDSQDEPPAIDPLSVRIDLVIGRKFRWVRRALVAIAVAALTSLGAAVKMAVDNAAAEGRRAEKIEQLEKHAEKTAPFEGCATRLDALERFLYRPRGQPVEPDAVTRPSQSK